MSRVPTNVDGNGMGYASMNFMFSLEFEKCLVGFHVCSFTS
jgi:hypothetical protein